MSKTYLTSELNRLKENEFCDMINGKYGWSVASQCRDIFDGEELEEQNPNALQYIAEYADDVGEQQLSNNIWTYLNKIGYEP